jgi:hypothetical protein
MKPTKATGPPNPIVPSFRKYPVSGQRPTPFPGRRVSLVGGFEVDMGSEVCCIIDPFLFSDRSVEKPGAVSCVSYLTAVPSVKEIPHDRIEQRTLTPAHSSKQRSPLCPSLRLGLEMALVMRDRESLASQLVMWTKGTKAAEQFSYCLPRVTAL